MAARFDGDLVLVPNARLDGAAQLLNQAGHRVVRQGNPPSSQVKVTMQ